MTTATTDLSQATAAPSLAPRDSLSGEQTPNDVDHSQVYHGAIRVHGSQQYKMHQIAHGTFQGVSLEEWDDSIHVKDDTKLDISGLEFADAHTDVAVSHPGSTNALASRIFRYATCQVVLQCVYNIGTQMLIGLERVLDTLLKTALAAYNRASDVTLNLHMNRNDIWNFLNRPFIIAIAANAIGSAIGGMAPALLGIYAALQTTKSDTTVKQCSDTENELNVVRDAVHGVFMAQHDALVSDASIGLTLPDGKTVGIMVNARPTGDTTPEVCGAPTTTPH